MVTCYLYLVTFRECQWRLAFIGHTGGEGEEALPRRKQVWDYLHFLYNLLDIFVCLFLMGTDTSNILGPLYPITLMSAQQ